MSSNPNLGHLYHDGSISSVFIKLDVQEKLRTRELNARENKYLEKYTNILDRAKTVISRQNAREQRDVKSHLRDIRWKTPTLKSGLRRETQRELNVRTQGAERQTLSLPSVRPQSDNRELVLVSSWSVYSNARVRNHSAQEKTSGKERLSWDPAAQALNTRTSNFQKKTEHITRVLHRLYNRGEERKRKEQATTVLDILGQESREELEKALFTLRGTPAGDVIEDILRERQFVSKKSETKTPSTSAVPAANVTEKVDNDGTNSDSAYGSGFLPTLPESDNVCIENLPRKPININKWVENGGTLVTAVFDGDDGHHLSSVLGNASDTEPHVSGGLKWMELFNAPELWRQKVGRVQRPTRKPKAVSLVTLTGRRRTTLMKK